MEMGEWRVRYCWSRLQRVLRGKEEGKEREKVLLYKKGGGDL